MSAFLAPIHTWLFNKILLAQELEKNIVKAHIEKYGKNIEDIQDESVKIYGDYISDKPLEDLIDTNNIHGWLQDRIKEVESRSSYIITRYFEQYKEESKMITKEVYKLQATQCAKKENNKTSLPEDVYISLNNYILAGMPCDRANSIIEKNQEFVVYQQNSSIYKNNLELGKADLEYIKELRELWIKTFVENVEPKYLYETSNEGNISTNKIIKVI